MSKGKILNIAFKLDAMLSSRFGKSFEKAESSFARVGDRLSKVGKGLTLGVTTPLMGIAAASLMVRDDFEGSLSTIEARTGMAADEVAELGKAFRNMAVSGDYGIFSAREIAGAYAGIAVKGQDAAYGTEIMRTAMVLATAVGDDLGNTAYFLGNYLLKVGKDASYAEKYINVFAATNQKTQIGLATLQDYLFRSNVTLQATNVSGAEASAMFGLLYQAGIRGAQAYSGVEAASRALLRAEGAHIQVLRDLGIERYDQNGQLRDGIPFLMDVAHALSELEGSTLDYKIGILGATDSGRAFLGGMVDIRGSLPDAIESLYEAAVAVDGTGTAFQMAAIQQGGLADSAQQLRNSLEEIKLQIAEQLMPHAQRFIDVIVSLIQRFASLDKGTQRTVVQLAMVAAAAGPVLMVTGKIIKAVGAAKAAYTAFTSTITAVKKATELANAAQAVNTKLTKVNTATAETAKKASAARAVAKSAETKALKLAAQADALRATAGANSAKAIAAATKAEQARTAANTAAKVASKKMVALEKIQANAKTVNTAAIKANTAAKNANALATSKLGKTYAFLLKAQSASAAGLKAKSAALAGVTVKSKVLALGTKGLSIAFGIMSKAIMAIPVFGWIAAGITIVAAGIAFLIGRMRRVGEEYQALGNEVEGVADRQRQLTDSAAGSAEEFVRNTRIMQEYHSQLDSVADRTEHLANMQSANLAEKARLNREAIELDLELQDVYTRRVELYEKLNDGTNRRGADQRALEAAINYLIEAEDGYRAALEANAVQLDFVNGLYNENILALEGISRAQQEAAIETYGFEMAMRRQAFTAEEWANAQNDALSKMSDSFERHLSVAGDAFSRLNQSAAISVDDMIGNLNANAAAVEQWSTNLAILTEKGLDEGLIEQLRQAGPAAGEQADRLVQELEKVPERLYELNEAYANSVAASMEAMKKEFDPEGVAQSVKELIDNVALAILENNAMENAFITQINAAFGALCSAVAEAGFDELGENIIGGAVLGIENSLPAMETAGYDTISTYLESCKAAAGISSPSRKMQQIGIYLVQGLVKGTEDTKPDAISIAEALATTFIETIAEKVYSTPDIGNAVRSQVENIRKVADEAVQAANFASVGEEIVNGIARGIESGGGIVSNAAQTMVNNALSAMKAAADIHSPSRKTWEMGQYLVEGLTEGMYSKYDEMTQASEDIIDGIAGSMYSKIGELEKASKHITDVILDGFNIKLPSINLPKLPDISDYSFDVPPLPIEFKDICFDISNACDKFGNFLKDSLYIEPPAFDLYNWKPDLDDSAFNFATLDFSLPTDTIDRFSDKVLSADEESRAFSITDNFSRFRNLNEDANTDTGSDGVGPSGYDNIHRPLDSIKRMEGAAATYQGSVYNFEYHAGDVTVNGSDQSIDDIKNMMRQLFDEDRAWFEEMVYEIEDERNSRMERIANE